MGVFQSALHSACTANRTPLHDDNGSVTCLTVQKELRMLGGAVFTNNRSILTCRSLLWMHELKGTGLGGVSLICASLFWSRDTGVVT